MGKAVIASQLETLMLESTLGEKLKGTASTTGPTETLTLVNFTTVKNMDKDTGRRVVRKNLTNIKAVTHTMKNMAMVNSSGLQVANIKEIMSMM